MLDTISINSFIFNIFYGKNQLNLIVARNVALFDVITILPILSNNKDNVPFTWPAGIQNILFLTNI
jgi:hypothetical protein